jgi:hypothetical protein
MGHWGVAAVLAVGVFCSGVATARAQEASDLEARIQFDQGVMLFEEGKFAQAAVAFRRAYELKPTYKLWWNVAQVENELGHYSAALEAYSSYLAEGGDEVSQERRDKVQAQIDRLRYRVGEIDLECPVAGATVYVNGKDRGTTPLDKELFVDIGEHEIEVRKGGERLHREVVAVAGRQRVTVRVQVSGVAPTPEPEVPPEPTAEADEPEPEPEPADGPSDEGKPRIWTWVAGGIGVAAGVTGAILGVKALKRKNSFMDECGDDGECVQSSECGSGWLLITSEDPPTCREDDRDQVKTLSLTADILYGVAAAGIATGVVLFFLEPRLGDDKEVAVAPAVTDDVAGVVIVGEF